MPVKMVSEGCEIATKKLTDRTGVTSTYVFCMTKEEKCPRDTKTGKKAYDLGPACFENVTEGEFMSNVALPLILGVPDRPEEKKC